MRKSDPPLIDMYPDGSFRSQAVPRLGRSGSAILFARVFRVAVIVAAVAGVMVVALLALWFALLLIPVAFVAGLVAWGALRFQLWRGGHRWGGSVRRF